MQLPKDPELKLSLSVLAKQCSTEQSQLAGWPSFLVKLSLKNSQELMSFVKMYSQKQNLYYFVRLLGSPEVFLGKLTKCCQEPGG